jgi:hypothetical protein
MQTHFCEDIMKKKLLLLLAITATQLLGVSTYSHAALAGESPSAISEQAGAQANDQPSSVHLSLINPASHQMESLSMNQLASADKMRDFVAPLPNATGLYDAYLALGYLPFHSMIMTNWDISEILRTQSPSLPDNPSQREKIAGIHKIYQPVK